MKKRLGILGMAIAALLAAFVLGRVTAPARRADEVRFSAPPLPRLLGGEASPGAKSTIASAPSRSSSPSLVPVGIIAPAAMEAIALAIIKEGDPIRAQRSFADLLAALTPENAKAALEAFRNLGNDRDESHKTRLEQLLGIWGRLDGASAMVHIQDLSKGKKEKGDFGRANMAVMSGWAAKDADAARAWLMSQDSRDLGAYAGVLRGLMSKNTDEAKRFLNELPHNLEGKGKLVGMLVEELLDGPDALATARSWVEGLKDPEAREAALDRVVVSYAKQDPKGAAEWLGKQTGDASPRQATAQVANQWAKTDPLATLRWLATMPSATQTQGFAETLGRWAKADPRAASEYLTKLPASSNRDYAVGGFIGVVADEDPRSAAAWAATITDEQIRQKALRHVGGKWLESDPAAAQQWLNQTGLSAEAMADLRAAAQKVQAKQESKAAKMAR